MTAYNPLPANVDANCAYDDDVGNDSCQVCLYGYYIDTNNDCIANYDAVINKSKCSGPGTDNA